MTDHPADPFGEPETNGDKFAQWFREQAETQKEWFRQYIETPQEDPQPVTLADLLNPDTKD